MHSLRLLSITIILQVGRTCFGTSAFQHHSTTLQASRSTRTIWSDYRQSETRLWKTSPEQNIHLPTSWNEKYQELVNFQKQHGHLKVDTSTKLYSWMHYQRRKYAGNDDLPPMKEEQISLLDDIGFSWNPRGGPRGKAWNLKYRELADFYKKHGHLKVEYGESLYNWMATQRRKRAKSKNFASLTDDQIKLLDEIDFDWSPTGGTRDVAWSSKYQQLAEIHKRHGHLDVEGDSTLLHWKASQRRKRTGMKGYSPLTDEQIQLLDKIGFF